MIKTILFDLDGTLLDIDMDFFLQKYFGQMMDMAEKSGFDGRRLVRQVWNSTDVMINDINPARSNEDVFMEDFTAGFDCPRQPMQEFFDRFYLTRFPLLQQYCSSFPGVPEMMADLFQRGFKIVVATNAVFPHTALQQRLNWAGVGDYPYELITSFEVMHFCKPHVQYYREIADRIGVKPEECLMIGNDTGEDLTASHAGMKTFLVEDMLIDKGQGLEPHWRGRLPDLFAFLQKI